MFAKLIQFAAALGCLTLSFQTAAFAFPSTQSPKTYRLPSNTKPETYNISLRTGISEGRFDYDGQVSINILVVNATRVITLHSQNSEIQRIQLSRGDDTIELLPWQSDDDTEFLTIPTKSVELQPGSRYRLDIDFTGTLNSGEVKVGFFRTESQYGGGGIGDDDDDDSDSAKIWIAGTDFKPSYARSAFPCYDELGLKAKVTVQITHGANYTAASNMPGTRHDNADGTVTTSFATSPPMSMYQIAFSVTDYRYRPNAANATLPMGVYVNSKAFDQTQTLLELNERALRILENYFQIAYALPKLDQIVIDVYGRGSWGLIAYQPTVLVDENSTDTAESIYILSAVSYGVSHQWIGSLVTPEWWDFNWLDDGLTLYGQYIAMAKLLPAMDITQLFTPIYERVLRSHSNENSLPLTRHVDSRDEIDDLVGSVTEKGVCIIRMLAHALTESTFKWGMTNFLRNNAFSTVTEDDFFDEMDRSAKVDGTLDPALNVKQLFKSWTLQAGVPLLTVTRNYENGSITISQETSEELSDLSNSTTWWIPYNFATAKSPSFNDTTPLGWLPQNQRSQLIEPTANNSWGASDWVLFNKQHTGYYRVMYDAQNWKLIIDELLSGSKSSIPPMNRAQLIIDAHTFVDNERLPLDVLVDLVKYLRFETQFAPWHASAEALSYINFSLSGTDDYEGFRQTLSESIQAAMAQIQCKCDFIFQSQTCDVLKGIANTLDLNICPTEGDDANQLK